MPLGGPRRLVRRQTWFVKCLSTLHRVHPYSGSRESPQSCADFRPWATNLSQNEATLTSAALQTSAILASLGQAAFIWDLATDEISWSDHVRDVFPDIAPPQLSSGAEFAKLIEPERAIRSEALFHSPPAHGGDGVPYRI